MKSRTSFFDKTVFKKNLTRFAPAWGLFTVLMGMILISLIDGGSQWFCPNLCDYVQIASLITPCYALLCAQLLFGDLYNSRMCNALHALPLKRETWFTTHVLSGFVFHLIPTVLFALLAGLYAQLACTDGDWRAAALCLLGLNLQFACYFGIAVFSALCVGIRFAQAVVYGILNFGAVILGWVVDTLIVPMYYGVKINIDPFYYFSPIARMMQEPFCSQSRSYSGLDNVLHLGELTLEENFAYYFIVAALGIGLLFLARALYRRRKLECAGDFLAIRGLEPVFQVVYTVIVGAVFYFVDDQILGTNALVFLVLGLLVGWFTGKMLLERTPRVFGKKNLLGCGIMMAAVALVLGLASLDPFGIESWVPGADQVESVTLSVGHYRYSDAAVTVEDKAEIRKILDIHADHLEQHKKGLSCYPYTAVTTEEINKYELEAYDFDMNLTFRYKLTNGREVTRYYRIWMGDDTGDYLRHFFSTPRALFGYDPDPARFLAENRRIALLDTWEGSESILHTETDLLGLYEAMLADCRQGVTSQAWDFHHQDINLYFIYLDNDRMINVFSNWENTLQWLRSNGYAVDELMEKYNHN